MSINDIQAEGQTSNVHYQLFKVDNEPHCVWDVKLREKNLEAIRSIDPDYFLFLTDLYYSHLQTANKDKAAMAIRTTYYHAAETLFSLIAATIQAPYCIYAWMLKYWPRHVRNIIEGVFSDNFEQYLHPDFSGKVANLNDLSRLIHLDTSTPEKQLIADRFARFWQEISVEFLDDRYRNEYNSLKHGHRAMSGGFFVAFDKNNAAGDRERTIQGSEFGSSFLTAIDMQGSNFYTRKFSLNWNPQGCAFALKLIALSIHNIKSFLLYINKAVEQVVIVKPENINEFDIPRQLRPSPNFIDLDFNINIAESDLLSKSDMLKKFTSQKEK